MSGESRLTVFSELSDGVQTMYPVRFELGYLNRADVYVYQGEHGDYANQLTYTWVDADNIELAYALPEGEQFWIRRIVNRRDLNYYFQSASLNPRALDRLHLQLLMLQQELMDGFGDKDGLGNIKNTLDMRGYNIINMKAGVGDKDAANKGQLDAVDNKVETIIALLNALGYPAIYDKSSLILSFDTIADIKNAGWLQEGQAVDTQGYYEKGDGGQARYLIKSLASFGGIPDERGDHTLGNGTVAVLQDKAYANPKQYGARANGTYDDSASISAAQVAGEKTAVFNKLGNAFKDGLIDIHPFTPSALVQDATYRKVRTGSPNDPTQDNSPVLWVHKYTSSNRDDQPTKFDLGGVFSVLEKRAGDTYGQSIYGGVRHIGGQGDLIGVHGRGQGRHKDAKVWGGWFYADMLPADNEPYGTDCIGVEVNVNNRGAPVLYIPPAGVGSYRGLVVLTADGSKAANIAIDVGKQNSTEGWMTGIRLRSNGIVPADVDKPTAQILVEGSSSQIGRYHGIRFAGGHFTTGIDFTEITGTISNNAAIVLRRGDRIMWGERTSSRWVSVLEDTAATVNFNNFKIGVNGIEVVGERRTGWEAQTGTTSKANFISSTVTTEELGKVLKALISDLRIHGLIGD